MLHSSFMENNSLPRINSDLVAELAKQHSGNLYERAAMELDRIVLRFALDNTETLAAAARLLGIARPTLRKKMGRISLEIRKTRTICQTR